MQQNKKPSGLNAFTLAVLIAYGSVVAPLAQAQLANPEEPAPIVAPAPQKAPAPKKRVPREPTVSFGVFSEPIELTTLIDYVGASLNINIVVKGSPTGEIVFNAPVQVPRSKLIDLLDALLEPFAFTISYDPDSKFYMVQPITDVRPVFGTERATSRIIPTPNIKPSLIVAALQATLDPSKTNVSTNSKAIQAVDELGVVIVNAPPRDIRRIEQMIAEFIRLDNDQQYIRFELNHLAAPTALDRAIRLVGGSRSGLNQLPGQRNLQNNQQQGGGSFRNSGVGSSLSNLAERITIDPQGNALIFKGTEDEIERVRQVLAVIDVPNTLEPRNYFAGSSAAQIADIAKRRGLGEVIQMQTARTQNQNQNRFANFGNPNPQLNQQNSNLGEGGPVMVVDPTLGNIIYYGTDDQHAQLAALLSELKTADERVVIREYVLNHTDAVTIADLINAIISGQQQTGNSSLLPGSTGRNTIQAFSNGFPIDSNGDSTGAFDPTRITVIADEFSNQIIIKAPIKQQEDLEALVARLDRRRSQVYIQAMIVSIADTEDFTLAFENQINAGQYSMGTNFGLSAPGATFTDPKTVSTGLGGFTAAVIKSQYIPLIINATQTNADVRILSTPQLLVNNNQESSIVSTEEQPYATISQGTNGGQNLQGLGGTVQAGTTLTVTPSISESGFIRLEYYVELSNFIGVGQNNLPPPTNRRTIEGSATVPSDATIVIGGISVEDTRNTIIKVPLLGDIPIVGELFKRTNKAKNKSKLYVFLTPRIMTDPNFNDLKLFSKGPQSEMGIDSDIPELEPAIITAPGAATTSALPTPMVEHASEPHEETSAGTTPPPSPPELEPVFIDLTDANAKGDE